MMRSCFISTALFFGIALLVSCGSREDASQPNPVVDLPVAGQTVTKVRAAGNQVVLLQQRLNSIFENGPQRTLATLQSDGHTLQTYVPPSGWSVIDFAVHPSGDTSVILTTARGIRIVRLDSKGSVRTDQPFLDPIAPTDPYFNYEGGIKDD